MPGILKSIKTEGIKMKSKKYVYVTDKHFVTKESIYVNLFKCPNCDDHIEADFIYCSTCGMKLYWKLENEY